MVKPSLQGVGAEARGAWDGEHAWHLGKASPVRAGSSMLNHGTSQEVEEKS